MQLASACAFTFCSAAVMASTTSYRDGKVPGGRIDLSPARMSPPNRIRGHQDIPFLNPKGGCPRRRSLKASCVWFQVKLPSTQMSFCEDLLWKFMLYSCPSLVDCKHATSKKYRPARASESFSVIRNAEEHQLGTHGLLL